MLLAGPPPLLGQDPPAGGAPAPPAPAAPDNRFFVKEMEDRLLELTAADAAAEARYDALLALRRMIGLEGSREPLLARVWEPAKASGIGADHEALSALAGEFMVALDRDRAATELFALAKGERDARRIVDLATMAEAMGAPKGVELLAGPLASAATSPESLARVVDALGALRAIDGVPLALAALRHEMPSVRNAAAMALGRMGDLKAIPALLAGLGDSKGNHGWFCAEALGLLEGESVFPQILARSAGGGASGPRAKAMDVAARARHLPDLVQLVQKGGAIEVRAAAANALGRLGAAGAAATPGTTFGGEGLTPEGRSTAAAALLEVMVSDGDPDVRGAAFWALRTCADAAFAEKIFKRLGVQGDDKLIYLVTLLGDLKYRPFAPHLLRAIFEDKRIMVRRASAVAFWQIRDDEQIEKFEQRLLGASDIEVITRGCEALGSWKDDRAFKLAMRLLRGGRSGSPQEFQVEIALEKMTGHFFGPSVGLWEKWIAKNPGFFSPKQAGIEREKWREEFDKENKGFRQTKATENAVQMGLRWLARHQGHDGVVDSVDFKDRCDPSHPCDKVAGARTRIAEAGTTGLSMLAFTGAGYTPAGGKYSATLRRGLDHLSATVNVFGDYEQADLLFNRGYARPVALQALAEGFALSGDLRYRWAAERIMARQFALMNERGGWRYSLKRAVPEVDSSVTAWVLFALKTSEKSGIAVPKLLFEGCYLSFDLLTERVPQNGPREEWLDIDPEYGFSKWARTPSTCSRPATRTRPAAPAAPRLRSAS
jgi:HEAT repeat protein